MLRAASSFHKATAVWAETMSPHPDHHGDSQAMAVHTEGTNRSQEVIFNGKHATPLPGLMASNHMGTFKKTKIPAPGWTRELGS